MITRRIADKIADLSEGDAKRLHEMIFAVNRMSQILHKNEMMTFTSDTLYITYMVSWDKGNEIRTKILKKEMDDLKEKTQDKIHYAVFSFSPIFDNYQSGYFVPPDQ